MERLQGREVEKAGLPVNCLSYVFIMQNRTTFEVLSVYFTLLHAPSVFNWTFSLKTSIYDPETSYSNMYVHNEHCFQHCDTLS